MRVAKTSASTWWFLATLLLLGATFTAMPPSAMAQCNSGPALKGFNAVYGNCGTTNQGTFAMIDASQYNSSGDICLAIQTIFNTYNKSTGLNLWVVVDARGFNPGQIQSCSDNPWDPGIVEQEPLSSIVLLPSGTIKISATWVLPTDARIIGQGPNVTVIQAISPFVTAQDGSQAMIEMGNSACPGNDCRNQSIEDLTLDGHNVTANGYGLNGIFNGFAQELSRVNDVAFTNITGIGLKVTNITAADSGPYSNLTMSNTGTCLEILAGDAPLPLLYTTRGVHGLTCSLSTTSPGPAISLDAPNNSLEDISIIGTSTSTQEGIVIGTNGPAEDNVLFNIRGSGLKNLIHITKTSSTNPPPNCPAQADSQKYSVCDVTILGVTNLTANTTTIQDDLINQGIKDANLAMYIVGEPVQAGSPNPIPIGYSRFTTSPSVPAWLVGTTGPSGTTCKVGSLYSAGSGTNTIYACATGTSWTGIK